MVTECGQYLELSTKWKTQLTEMIFREVGQDALVYLVLAEHRLILFEAQAPQPACHVHDRRPQSGDVQSSAGAEKVSRVALGVRRVSGGPLKSK
jgi:hypothetical protein